MPPPDRLLLGMLFMCLASTLFPMMNGLVQVLSARFPSEQDRLGALRGASHRRDRPLRPSLRVRSADPHDAAEVAGRASLVLLMSTCFAFVGFKYLELAKAASISFIAPFIVTCWPGRCLASGSPWFGC